VGSLVLAPGTLTRESPGATGNTRRHRFAHDHSDEHSFHSPRAGVAGIAPRRRPRRAPFAVHIMINTALTGATFDIDSSQQFVS
jgi:hypothetical protein